MRHNGNNSSLAHISTFTSHIGSSYNHCSVLANAERFITDELKELEDKILTCGDLFSKLGNSFNNGMSAVFYNKRLTALDNLRTDVFVFLGYLGKINKQIQKRDCGRYCFEFVYILGKNRFNLFIVETISKDKFIPNDVLLDEAANRTMIITGPNMAGKSTYMRQTLKFLMPVVSLSRASISASTAELLVTMFLSSSRRAFLTAFRNFLTRLFQD